MKIYKKQNFWAWVSVILISFFYLYKHQNLSKEVLPLGLGADEIAHIDNSYFLLRKPGLKVELLKGLKVPGKSPIYQGHQAPLSYIIGAKVLSLNHKDSFVSPFIDYQSGMQFNSDLSKYPSTFTVSEKVNVSSLEFRRGIYLLRALNGFYFLSTLLFTYIVCSITIKKNYLSIASFSILLISFPIEIWHSFFFSNDILVSTLSAFTYILSLVLLIKKNHSKKEKLSILKKFEVFILNPIVLTILCTFLSAASFFTKYNGIVSIFFVLFAILLKNDFQWKKKLALSFLSLSLFTIVISPEIYKNQLEFSGFFTNKYITKVSPQLFKPQSISTFLSDVDFFKELSVNSAFISKNFFPQSTRTLILAALVLSFTGIILFLLNQRKKKTFSYSTHHKNLSLHAAGSLLLIFAVFICFSLKFPVANGRYLFPAKIPLTILFYFGIKHFFLSIFSKPKTEIVELLFCMAFFILILNSIENSSSKKFEKEFEQDLQVESGVQLIAADINNDQNDELVFFHRARGRIFIAEHIKENSNYNFVPKWSFLTRDIVSEIKVVNFFNSNKDDILFWNKAISRAYILNVEKLLEKDLRFLKEIMLSAPPASKLFYNKNSDTKKFYLFSSKEKPNWKIINYYDSILIDNDYLQETVKYKYKKSIPFILKVNNKDLLANYSKESSLLSLSSPESLKLSQQIDIELNDKFISSDLNRDGFSEIISWKLNSNCFKITTFNFANNETLSLKNQQSICPRHTKEPIILTKDYELIEVRNNTVNNLIGFNKLTGIVDVISSTNQSKNYCAAPLLKNDCQIINKFDPMW